MNHIVGDAVQRVSRPIILAKVRMEPPIANAADDGG